MSSDCSNATPRNEASGMRGDSTNGVDNNREDDGWEMAAGNPHRIVSSGAARQRNPVQSETSYLSPVSSSSRCINRLQQVLYNERSFTPKGQTRIRLALSGNSAEAPVSESLKNNSSSKSTMSKQRDELTVRKRLAGSVEEDGGPFDKSESKRPTAKLPGSPKRKPEPDLRTEILIRVVQLLCILLILAYVILTYGFF